MIVSVRAKSEYIRKACVTYILARALRKQARAPINIRCVQWWLVDASKRAGDLHARQRCCEQITSSLDALRRALLYENRVAHMNTVAVLGIFPWMHCVEHCCMGKTCSNTGNKYRYRNNYVCARIENMSCPLQRACVLRHTLVTECGLHITRCAPCTFLTACKCDWIAYYVKIDHVLL